MGALNPEAPASGWLCTSVSPSQNGRCCGGFVGSGSGFRVLGSGRIMTACLEVQYLGKWSCCGSLFSGSCFLLCAKSIEVSSTSNYSISHYKPCAISRTALNPNKTIRYHINYV